MIEGFNAAILESGVRADPAQQAAALRLQMFYDGLIAFMRSQDYLASGHRRYETHSAGSRPGNYIPFKRK